METTDYPETLHPVCQTKEHSVTIAEESNVLSLSASVSTFFFLLFISFIITFFILGAFAS